MNKKCKTCPVSALCVEQGGPVDLGLYKCGDCGGVSIRRNGILTGLPYWDCHKSYVIFRDYQQRQVDLMAKCPHCRKRAVGIVRFILE